MMVERELMDEALDLLEIVSFTPEALRTLPADWDERYGKLLEALLEFADQ